MSISSVERHLRRTNQQIIRLRAELLLLEEQYAHFSDEAETARIHALVSETPISERTRQRTARHADVVSQERNKLKLRIGQLEGAQDLLLDQMNS
tara:strand:- start:73 stop:357 length:285 start_codon:yes stop_codon:yes gene_type:complete